MAAVCLAAGCSHDKDLFAFPYDSRRRKQWVTFMLEEQSSFNIEVYKRPSLCINHFQDSVIDNLIEVQAGLARVYRLNIDAVPSKHSPGLPLTSSKPPGTSSLHSEKIVLTVPKTAKASVSHSGKSIHNVSSKTSKQHTLAGKHKRAPETAIKPKSSRVTPDQKPSNIAKTLEPPAKSSFKEKQEILVRTNITEAVFLKNLPIDLSIRLNITGDKNGRASVVDINRCPYERVVGLLCHMFRVLLAEQDLGVICGRFGSPDDRLKRLTGLPPDHLNFLIMHPTFRDKVYKSRWPEFFDDYLMEKALVLRIKHYLDLEQETSKLVEPLWKPTLRLQKYTGLTQENAKVVKSALPILG